MRDEEFVANHLKNSYETLARAANDPNLGSAIVAIAHAIAVAMRNRGKLLIAGNGGSAGDAQHIAGEFLSRLNFDRNPLPAIALTTDTSVLTAIGNDYGFDMVFERQVKGLALPGDVLLVISTSGSSRNIVAALKVARQIGVTTIGFTGDGQREMNALCDYTLCAPSSSTPRIQEVHIVAAHAICGLVELRLFGDVMAKTAK